MKESYLHILKALTNKFNNNVYCLTLKHTNSMQNYEKRGSIEICVTMAKSPSENDA